VIETYRALLQAEPTLETVITRLGLPYTVRQLAGQLSVDILPNTQLLRLRVEDGDPQRAADIANEIDWTFLLQRSAGQQLTEIENYEQALVDQMNGMKLAIDRTEAEIRQLQAAPGLMMQDELARLQEQQSQQRATYGNLLAGYLNLRNTKSRLMDVTIITAAEAPVEPIGPSRSVNTAIAAAGGIVIAGFVAFLLEYLNDRVRDEEELREVLALPSLGTIPVVGSWQKNGHASVDGEDLTSAEAFRVLRTNIQFSNVDRGLRTLLVTSSVPEEGKTSIAANLGTAMAKSGRHVLLVDADLRQPHLHLVFKVPGKERGLTSLLVNEAGMEECIVKTSIPNLDLLPSGPIPPNPSELLESRRMEQLLDELQARADILLFDVPPVLVFADAAALASRMDGVILVVDSRSTRRKMPRQALEALRKVEAQVLGGVLNKASTSSIGYYQYYSERDRKLRPWERLLGGGKRRAERTRADSAD
jgi:non-specific protein-tyrosine kinase